jgi:hypothetical protein
MTRIVQHAPPAVPAPVRPHHDGAAGLQTSSVYVLFTTFEETLGAVRVASDFAKTLEVPLTVLHFRAVSYPLDVDAPAGISPAETVEFTDRLRQQGLDVRVQVYLCRDALTAVPLALGQPSLVVIGQRRRWWEWRSLSERWRRALEARGHLVVLAKRETSRA